MSTAHDLEFYLDRKPTADEIEAADEWLTYNPGEELSAWVEAMIEIGAL